MDKRIFVVLGLALLAVLVAGCVKKTAKQPSTEQKVSRAGAGLTAQEEESVPEKSEPAEENPIAVMKTNLGDIKIELFEKDAPKTVANFIELSDRKFYEGIKFHRVIRGFMVQSGCPNSKDDDWSDDGTGGPGYEFEDEFNSHKLVRGTLAMANRGPNTNGSQFFIVTAPATPHLDGRHTAFGRVVGGMPVVDEIEAVETNSNDHPLKDIVIEEIIIE